jgi:DNA-binding MarR family transcriptional regulator
MENPKVSVGADVAGTSQPTAEELAAEVNDLLPTMAAKLLHFVREVPGIDITLAQGFVLRHIQVHGSCTASTIGSMMGITSGPVTSLTKRLIEKGLVRRTRDPEDGRVYWFSLTSEGEAAATMIASYRKTEWKRLVEELGVARTMEAMQLMRETIEILNRLT